MVWVTVVVLLVLVDAIAVWKLLPVWKGAQERQEFIRKLQGQPPSRVAETHQLQKRLAVEGLTKVTIVLVSAVVGAVVNGVVLTLALVALI
jgi:hypothetical protein